MHRINEHPVQPVWWQKQFAQVAIVHRLASKEACAGREATCVARLFMTRGVKPLHDRSELCGRGSQCVGKAVAS